MTELEHSQRLSQDKHLMLKELEDETGDVLTLIFGKIKQRIHCKKNSLLKISITGTQKYHKRYVHSQEDMH